MLGFESGRSCFCVFVSVLCVLRCSLKCGVKVSEFERSELGLVRLGLRGLGLGLGFRVRV